MQKLHVTYGMKIRTPTEWTQQINAPLVYCQGRAESDGRQLTAFG